MFDDVIKLAQTRPRAGNRFFSFFENCQISVYDKGDTMSSKKCVSSEDFSTEDLMFGESEKGELQDGTNFERIPISVRKPDGTVSPLIIVSDTCFSFGVQKDSKYDTRVIPLMLYDRDVPTREQKLFVKVIQDIVSACKPKPKSCFYGNEGNPILYLKLDFDKRFGEYVTKFYERKTMTDKKSTKEIKPEKYVGKHCVVKVVVSVDSVFIAKTTSLQIKAHTVIFSEAKRKRPVEVVDVTDEM